MDKILFNGEIYTLDKNGTKAEAIGIKEGRIEAIGSSDDILKFKNENTELIDLKGKMTVPGFIDSHMHLISYGYALSKVALSQCKSIDEMIEKGKEFIQKNNFEKEDWIQGRGWNHDYFDEKRVPNRHDLDKISTEHPICFARACGHIAVVNTKALEVAKIDEHPKQPDGGYIDVDESRKPTGVIRENALKLIYGIIPDPDLDKVKEMITNCIDDALEQGITSIHTDDFEQLPSKDYKKIIKAYRELAEEDNLNIRVYEQSLFSEPEKLKDFLNNGYNTGWGDEFFKIGPLKLLADGSLGARTAYMTEAYFDDESTKGIPIFTQDELDELVMMAHMAGMQIAVHGIGDGIMHMIGKSLEKALKEKPVEDHRHGIVHAQITDLELIEKFKEMNLIAYIQPIFLHYDMHIVEERIGKERAKYTYNWKRMIDMGIHLAGGSDAPVEKFDILPNIYSAVTRKDLNGNPKNGWLPEQKVSVEDALRMFTVEGAYASFEEDVKGTLEVGKYADLVVLEDNLFNINPDKIKDVRVELTMVNGKTFHKRGDN
ncbi:MAG: amidohydrolase [Bacillota bacterium]|nr:amidohydrolase [Bacillota bacterium]